MKSSPASVVRSAAPNLVRILSRNLRPLLSALGLESDFEIIKRRHGLEGSEEYTLEEIGKRFKLTMQRISQREARATKRLYEALAGVLDLPELDIPKDIRGEFVDLIHLLKSKGTVIPESEIINLLEARYGCQFTDSDLCWTRLLLNIFGFKKLPELIPHSNIPLRPSWVTVREFHKPPFYQNIAVVHRTLSKAVAPMSISNLAGRIKEVGTITPDIPLIVSICADFEITDSGQYQIKFESLSSVADKAYRVLYEANERKDVWGILEDIDNRMGRAFAPTRSAYMTLVRSLSRDQRFVAGDSSGIWGLAEWKDPRKTSIRTRQWTWNSLP